MLWCSAGVDWLFTVCVCMYVDRVRGVCGEMRDVSLPTLVSSNDVLVMTPQILVNALQRGELSSLSTFTLLLLDECHNTIGKHPYNKIMSLYIDSKHSTNTQSLPQVSAHTNTHK